MCIRERVSDASQTVCRVSCVVCRVSCVLCRVSEEATKHLEERPGRGSRVNREHVLALCQITTHEKKLF